METYRVCPRCEALESETDWEQATQKRFTRPIRTIKESFDSTIEKHVYYHCPSCEKTAILSNMKEAHPTNEHFSKLLLKEERFDER